MNIRRFFRNLNLYTEAYRIRHGYGLSPIRNKRELRALIEFCREELKDVEHMKLNPERREAYEKTVKLYEEGEYGELYYYIKDHCAWYWN